MARDEMDSIMNLADEKLSEMCKELCHLVTIELQKATDSLVSQVEQKLEVRKVPTASRAWEGETLHEVEGASEFQSFLGDDCVHAVNPKYLDDVGEKRPEKKPTLAWGTKISPENDESEAHPSPSEPNAPGGPTGAVKLNQSLSMKAQRETMIERIFGLVPDVGGGLQEDNMSQGRKQVLRFISSNCFEGFGIVMILLYSLEIGLQINYLAETRALDPGHVWRTIDWAFCLWFTVEVGLKLYVYRMRFFTMHGCAWNIMDFFLNILQIFEEVVAIVSLASANTQTVLNSGVMRTVRICRGIKVMRLVRTVRFAEELQLIVSCLILSVRTFLCVLSLLVMAIYVMAIYATQAVYVYHLENPVNPEGELVQRWGNIPTSMLSVFQALSGGEGLSNSENIRVEHDFSSRVLCVTCNLTDVSRMAFVCCLLLLAFMRGCRIGAQFPSCNFCMFLLFRLNVRV